MPDTKSYAHLFSIENCYIALNHGSFGACPTAVTEHRIDLMKRMESLTTRFFMTEMKPLLIESLNTLAKFVNAPTEDMVFVHNATFAANAVINSLPWKEGDEIITTNLIYESCSNLLNFTAKTKKVVLRIAAVDFPNDDDKAIEDKIFSLANDQTKMIFVDHLSSTTALLMPVRKIINKARSLGIETFIDGAHAPGMLPLDISSLKPDYYTGNCHKWLCAPKGAAFLYVKPERQHLIIPPVISNYFQKGETASEKMFNSFYWLGTMDYSSCLCVKTAIEHLEKEVAGGWEAIMQRNRSLVLKGRDIICDALGFTEYTPEQMSGSMVSIKTGTKSDVDPATTLDYLYYEMLRRHNIETIFAPLLPQRERMLRIGAHVYNSEEDFHLLADALKPYFRTK